uniref:Uncharacterized protein n=1 Tax=Pseudomonas aeruginosa TaxID=287 RepID=A0A7U3RMI1_PSEAI|nr:hypothetical protein [Pseudomonas aeruginosa]UGK55972.1 Hypothetical protein [Pseudomonas aeruginosa]
MVDGAPLTDSHAAGNEHKDEKAKGTGPHGRQQTEDSIRVSGHVLVEQGVQPVTLEAAEIVGQSEHRKNDQTKHHELLQDCFEIVDCGVKLLDGIDLVVIHEADQQLDIGTEGSRSQQGLRQRAANFVFGSCSLPVTNWTDLSDLRNASLGGEPAGESTADRQEDCQLRLRRNLGVLGLGSVSVLVHMDRSPMVETPIL